MPSEDLTRVVDLIERIGNLEEVAEVRTFRGYRPSKKGGMVETRVEILDRGPNAPSSVRYWVVATDELGRRASGNGGATLEETLAVVHWFDLDREPPGPGED